MNAELQNFRCPLCNKPLASDEYYRAVEKLKKKVAETYDEQTKKIKQEYEKKLQEISKGHESDILNLKQSHEEQLETLRKELENSYNRQLTELKRTYDKISRENKKNYGTLERKLQAKHKKEIEEKERQLAEIKKEQSRLKKLAFQEAQAKAEIEISKLRNDVKERDIQINRFQRDIDELKKQLSQSQSELKGEAGEIDLYAALTQAFQQDIFRRQKRGTVSGDIIQHIRTETATLEMPIVYDNKQANTVTKKDIEKAKNYKKIHGTDYVIIVSSNLPKKDIKNGLYGEKEGILLAHPSIIVEVVKQIRKAVIEIHRQSESKKDREVKESRLYDYIRGQEFTNNLEALHDIYQKMVELQDREEKAHQRLWKERRTMQSMINQTCNEISNGIDSIIQEKLPMEEFIEKDINRKQVEGPKRQLLQPLLVKSKKKKTVQTETAY